MLIPIVHHNYIAGYDPARHLSLSEIVTGVNSGATLTNLVPYTGGNANVDLGAYGLTAGKLSALYSTVNVPIDGVETSRVSATSTNSVQPSPRVKLSGTAYNATSGASNTLAFAFETLPVAGLTPTANLRFLYGGHGVAIGGYSEIASLSAAGLFSVAGGVVIGGSSLSMDDSLFTISTNGLGQTIGAVTQLDFVLDGESTYPLSITATNVYIGAGTGHTDLGVNGTARATTIVSSTTVEAAAASGFKLGSNATMKYDTTSASIEFNVV